MMTFVFGIGIGLLIGWSVWRFPIAVAEDRGKELEADGLTICSKKVAQAGRAAIHARPLGSALGEVNAEWSNLQRPMRLVQFAAVIHADNAEILADELEYMVQDIRQGNLTRGAGGGREANFAWCCKAPNNHGESD